MWERVATTRQQDRVLHGAAKLVNVLLGVIALPLWLLGQRFGGWVRGWLARNGTDTASLPVPVSRERTMTALMTDLERIPRRAGPSRTAELRKGLLDISSFVLTQHRDAGSLGYAYPSQFLEYRIPSLDGKPIAASVAIHEDSRRPGLVVVHGTFSTRRFDYVREIAVRAFYEWGFNVAAIDLRSFGQTELLTDAPNTGGWKEGEDVIAAARHLKQHGASSVGAIGISLGASAVLGGCHPPGAEDALDGGILAVSPPADVYAAARRVSERVPRNHPRYPITAGFRTMLTSRIRGGRWPESVHRLDTYLRELAAPTYGLTEEELWQRSSPVNTIGGALVPVLIIHPEDDHIVKPDQAKMLAGAARDNDLVRVWIVAGGGHGALDAWDRDWTWAVYRTFFERWADYPSRGAPAAIAATDGHAPATADR
jgi:predicted alpha/beta-fold hydrolase